jgi:hypothetical protein
MSIIKKIRTEYKKLIESGVDKDVVKERDFAKEYILPYQEIIKKYSPETARFAKEFWNIELEAL